MHSISNPSRVRFSGPLAPYAAGLRQELASLGYAASSAANLLQFAAHLSRWLEGAGIGGSEVTQDVLDRFLSDRRRRYTTQVSARALVPIVGYLRRLGALPAAVSVPAVSAADALLDAFARHLQGQRALTAPVVTAYVRWVRPFTQDTPTRTTPTGT